MNLTGRGVKTPPHLPTMTDTAYLVFVAGFFLGTQVWNVWRK